MKFKLNQSKLIEFQQTGAIFPNYGYGANVSQESDEEIVFKHAVYISNQYKLTYLNTPSNYPTLLHKIIHISKIDQLKTIKKSNLKTFFLLRVQWIDTHILLFLFLKYVKTPVVIY